MIKKLLEVPENVWDIYALRGEPLKNKIPEEELPVYLELAHRTGKELAARVRAEYPGQSPEQICEALKLRLNRIEEKDGGPYTMFACYTEPDRIDLYMGSIESLEKLLKEEKQAALPGEVPVQDILLAHELFHYYECHEPEFPTRRKLITLWKIGKFRYKSPLTVLSEIAAMEFAKDLLGLSWHPYLLDILLLYASDQPGGRKLHGCLLKLQEN